MRFVLLVLSLLTGAEASSVEGCVEGWVEFICKYPKTDKHYRDIYVSSDGPHARIRSTNPNVWEVKGNVSIYHDTGDKSLRVHVKGLTHTVKYKCEFYRSPQANDRREEKKVEVEIDNRCQSEFQSVSKGDKTSINCTRRDDGDDDEGVGFFCKENKSTCEDISPSKPNKDGGVSVSDVSSHGAGVYWCGVRSRDGNRAGRTRIQLEVKDTSTTVSPAVTTSAATSPVFSTTSAAAGSDGGSWLIVIIAVVISVLLLIILVFVWKRFKQIQKTRDAEVQNKKQDGLYEEIQERPQQPDSGTALKSIYVTADFPTNPSAHAHIGSGQSVSGNAVQEAERRPAQSAVNQPSRPPDDPFYSTVNLPQPL